MRLQNFMDWLRNSYDPRIAIEVASNFNFRGGYEGWLQVEIARTFIDHDTRICEREFPYPDGTFGPRRTYTSYNKDTQTAAAGANARGAARCDFMLQFDLDGEVGVADQTFIELKTNNSQARYPEQDAWHRFNDDITKISKIKAVYNGISAFALLAVWGTLDTTNDIPQGDPNGHTMDWYYAGNRQAFIWDTLGALDRPRGDRGIESLEAAQIRLGTRAQRDRLLFIGVSPP